MQVYKFARYKLGMPIHGPKIGFLGI